MPLTRTLKNGLTMVDDGTVWYLYKNDKLVGSIINRGLFKSSSIQNPLGYNHLASVTTSDSVFDIISPTGAMLVRGCITGTLWKHVERVFN